MMRWLVALALLAGTLSASAEMETLDRIVAVVNDGVIMQSELDQRIDRVRRRIARQGQSAPPDDVLENQVLDRMIDQKVQMQLARRANIQVGDSALNDALASIAERNGKNLEGFASQIRESGGDWSAFREQIRREMIISRLQKGQVGRKVHVTDREVDQFLDSQQGQDLFKQEYHLAHILLSTPSKASSRQVQQTRDQARKLVKQLRDGADFKDMAVARSDGQYALEGGDLGWRPAAELPSLFADAATGLQPGEISDPLRSGNGVHIIKLIEKRGGSQRSVEQHKVRHMLISSNKLRSENEARKRARALHERVANGADFAKLAERYSDDPGSAQKGGLLGWVSPGDMVPAFEDVMNKTPEGQLSTTFQTRFGWHFLRVLDTRTTDMSDDYRRSRARQSLQKRRFQEQQQRWLQAQRGEAYIDIRLDDAS